MSRIIIIAPYPIGQAPSQRFRFEQYIEILENEGFEVRFYPFLSDKTWRTLYKDGSFINKTFGILGSFARRWALMFKIRKTDQVFIHREAAMIGPPIYEWIIAKILRKKYIYDFDDAIWLPNYSESNAKFHRLKAYGKVPKIMKWAGQITAGNEYLRKYASQFNENIQVIPTTVDLENVHRLVTNHNAPPVIGWTGTHTTMHYLNELLPVLSKMEQNIDFRFRVISNSAPEFELDSLEFVPWNKETEIEDLAQINIGVMPLADNKWANGKCGFKGLQYMALEIPSILSPVGMNSSLIENGVNGFLCSTREEWESKLRLLVEDASLRQTIGAKGKKTIEERFSVDSNKLKFIQLFK